MYSPERLKMPISRPAISTILRPPGGISPAAATMVRGMEVLPWVIGPHPGPLPGGEGEDGGVWRGASGEAVHAAGVVAVDHLLFFGGHADFEGEFGVVHVPVRVVGGEEDALPADPVEDGAEVAGALGFVDG